MLGLLLWERQECTYPYIYSYAYINVMCLFQLHDIGMVKTKHHLIVLANIAPLQGSFKVRHL
jgi:hypothetical protein